LTNEFLWYASEAAHPFYILRQTVTVVIGYYVVQWNARLLVEFAVIAITSLVVTILLYDLVVKRTSMTHFLFGMRPKKEMAKETKPAVA